MLEDYLVSMAITIILSTIKNPAKKAALKKSMLKVFTSIRAAYPGDSDFS